MYQDFIRIIIVLELAGIIGLMIYIWVKDAF